MEKRVTRNWDSFANSPTKPVKAVGGAGRLAQLLHVLGRHIEGVLEQDVLRHRLPFANQAFRNAQRYHLPPLLVAAIEEAIAVADDHAHMPILIIFVLEGKQSL